jgi:hypothetical protein
MRRVGSRLTLLIAVLFSLICAVIINFSRESFAPQVCNTPYTHLSTTFSWLSTSSLSSSSVYPSCDLTGLKVLVTEVHYEGNLGDEMETTPLFHFLRHCNAHVTAQISGWLSGKIHPNSARNQALVDVILLQKDKINASEFDVVIQAPGPEMLGRPADAVFGCSINKKWGRL